MSAGPVYPYRDRSLDHIVVQHWGAFEIDYWRTMWSLAFHLTKPTTDCGSPAGIIALLKDKPRRRSRRR